MENWRTGLWVACLELPHHLKSVRTPRDAGLRKWKLRAMLARIFGACMTVRKWFLKPESRGCPRRGRSVDLIGRQSRRYSGDVRARDHEGAGTKIRTVMIAIVIFFGFSISLPSSAQTSGEIPSPPNSDADRTVIDKLVNYYRPVARTFNCKKFAWGSFVSNHTRITLEYVPESDDVNSWTRLMSITVFPLPKDTASQIEVMLNLGGQLLGSYGTHGKILSQENFQDSNGYPGIFIEYEIGEGIQNEHSAGAFSHSAPNIASFIQIQSRGKPFDQTDAANMKLFAQKRLPLSPN
jgi:hypothetical protein